jgi:3'-phosphoadenosine 5'-phosphosulfate sulfotransferase (PAPS reductase)/FAD synthetase
MEEGHTKERLRALQALPLERKIGFTIARIVEWHTHYNGKVYVSFSGGKDSTVLLDIARGLFPDIKEMFVDTGLEYPEIREFIKTFDNVDIVRPKMSFKQVIETYGYPVVSKEVAECVEYARISPSDYKQTRIQRLNGELKDKNGNLSRWNFSRHRYLLDAPFKISNRCCSVMKKAPANAYTKSTGTYPIIATMADESFLRESTWIRQGCNAFNSKHPKSAPMSFWTEQDVLQYIKLKNLPIASVYGRIESDTQRERLRTTGCSRTGCVFCLFGLRQDKPQNRIQRLALTHPKLHDYCINKLGLKEVMEFMGDSYIPERTIYNAILAKEHGSMDYYNQLTLNKGETK